MTHLSSREAEGFYAVHKARPFFNDLVTFMTAGPVVLMVLAGVAFLGFCAISMLPGDRDMSQAALKPAE